MLKKILIVVIGLLLGVVTIQLAEKLGHIFYPPPKGLDFDNLEVVRHYVMNMPMGAYFLVIGAHALGAFVAGFAVTKISQIYLPTEKQIYQKLALRSAILLTIAGALLFYILPHPMWVMIVDLLIYLPMAYSGYKLASK